MKKILAFVMAMVLVLAMAACSVNVNAPVPTAPAAAASETKGNTASVSPLPTDSTPTEPAPTVLPTVPDPEPTPEPDPEPVDAGFVGGMDGNTYVNEFIGFSCDLTDYTTETIEALATRNGLAAGATDADFQAKAKNAPVFVLFATNAELNNNININIQCTDTSTATDAEMKAVVEAMIPAVIAEYEGMGFTDLECEYAEIEIDGEKKHALVMEGKLQGNDFGVIVFMHLGDNFLATVTMGGMDTAAVICTIESIKLN